MVEGRASGQKRPIVEGLFTWPSDQPKLIASRCKSCNLYAFPKSSVCQNPTCSKEDVEEVTLGSKGKLWSYTYEFYEPPPPFRSKQPFAPYGIGLVELPEGIRVLGMLTDCSLEDLRLDMDVELVIETQYEDELGNEFLTWKFRPIR